MNTVRLSILLCAVFLGSCTNTTLDSMDGTSKVNSIHVKLDTPKPDTRLFIKDINNNFYSSQIQNFIENDDTIGIFPDRGDQIPFIISGMSSPQTSFTFSAEGWGLMSTVEYFAYMPFNRSHNFSDYNNVTHVYVNYYGQHVDKDMANADVMFGALDYTGKDQSYYSYMYSEPTSDPANTGYLNFQMHYLGGWVVVEPIIPSSGYAPGKNASNSYFVLAKLVATSPIFRAEGSYNLKIVGTNSLSGIWPQGSDIVPTERGRTNTLSVKLDSVQCLGSYNDFMLSFAVPPVDFHEIDENGNYTTCTIYFFDSEGNMYMPYQGGWIYDAFGNTQISNGFCYSYSNDFRFVRKAAPEEMKIEPWEREEESINSNWNYK